MPETASAGRNNRILCVDDEKDIVQAYVDFLALASASSPARRSSRSASPAAAEPPREGMPSFEVLTAYSGESAIELFLKEKSAGRNIAGGFFDVKMDGGIDGLQTVREIWKIDPRFHVTIVTAYQDRSVQDINLLFGPEFANQWDYLNKPFTSGEILQKARQMTSAWNRMRNLERALLELQEAQDQLVRSERMAAIGQVARGIGHEFGNILQRIVGKADLAMAKADPEAMKESLGVILQSAERAAVIVRNLQSFSKGSSDRSRTDLARVAKDAIALMSHEFVKASIALEDLTVAGSSVTGNAIELQQILMNLLINAVHATPKNGKITVTTAVHEDAVELMVDDTGSGISPETLPRIFDYAFTTKGDHGSGLGLSISKQIVEEHGGTISVQSALGKGTRFTLRFPRVK